MKAIGLTPAERHGCERFRCCQCGEILTMNRRCDIKAILRDPAQRRRLMVDVIIATQAREGIRTTRDQAEAAYAKVQDERR